jgi:hypothetical protein
MRTFALSLLLFSAESGIQAQVIVVRLDTTQFFEHSRLLSTTQAMETDKLTYTTLYEHKDKFEVRFDLNRGKEFYLGYENDIIQNNNTTNMLDVIIQEGDQESLVILGKTDNGGMMYLFEYHEGDMIKGFFSKNPEIIILNQLPDSNN